MTNNLNWQAVLNYANEGSPTAAKRVEKTPDEWATELKDDVFQVTRLQGTERPFSGEHCGIFKPGLYACACCDEHLFDASEKFESNSGWPSFTAPLSDNALAYIQDESHGMVRVEVTCNCCDAHLGHVFPDGPQPTGLRYCMNSLALKSVNSES